MTAQISISPIYFLFFISYFLFFSCSSPTTTNTVTFSGTVTLEDTTDFSGVTVSLYAPVELDTALVRINKQYPNIGVQISQETEFDHREHEPLYSTTTDKNGKWQIKASEGEYNMVAEKEGWGWKYVFKQSPASGLNAALYRVQILSGVLSDGITFKTDHVYKLQGNVIFPDGFNYIFQSNALLLAGSGAKALFYGNPTFPENGFVFFKGGQPQESYWNGIELYKQGSGMHNIFISNAGRGLSIKANSISIQQAYLQKAKSTGVALTNVSAVSITHSLITGSITGMDFYSLDSAITIEANLFAYNTDVALLANEARPVVKNNYFGYNQTAISCQFNSNAHIEHNQIEFSDLYGIVLGGSDPLIEYNNLNGNKSTSIRIPPTGYAGSSNPIIHFNNFEHSDIHIYIHGTNANPNKFDINAKNNWWGTGSKTNIINLITDKSDLSQDDPNISYTGYVNFEPYSFSFQTDSGIQ